VRENGIALISRSSTHSSPTSYFFANPPARFIRDLNAFAVLVRTCEYETRNVFCRNGSRLCSGNEMLTLHS
jgi:hypothetical protein